MSLLFYIDMLAMNQRSVWWYIPEIVFVAIFSFMLWSTYATGYLQEILIKNCWNLNQKCVF